MSWEIPKYITQSYAHIYHSDQGRRRRYLYRAWSNPREFVQISNSNDEFTTIGLYANSATNWIDDFLSRKEYMFAIEHTNYQKYSQYNICDLVVSSSRFLNEANVQCKSNIKYIAESLTSKSSDVVLAYGNVPEFMQPHVEDLLQRLKKAGVPLFCFGRLKNGMPTSAYFIPKNQMKLYRYW